MRLGIGEDYYYFIVDQGSVGCLLPHLRGSCRIPAEDHLFGIHISADLIRVGKLIGMLNVYFWFSRSKAFSALRIITTTWKSFQLKRTCTNSALAQVLIICNHFITLPPASEMGRGIST